MKNLLCLFLLVTSIGSGQINQVFLPSGTDIFDGLQDDLTVTIEGTPYLIKEFKTGSTFIHGRFGYEAPMRYNAGKNVIEFLDSDQIIREVLRRPYIKVHFEGKVYEIIDYNEEGIQKSGYFNPIAEGKIKLYFKPQKKLVKKHQFGTGTNDVLYPTYYYLDNSSYYLKKEDRPAEKIRLNKKAILNYLEDNVSELTTFVSDNGLNLKKEEDVVRLLNYYSSLTTPKRSEKEMRS